MSQSGLLKHTTESRSRRIEVEHTHAGYSRTKFNMKSFHYSFLQSGTPRNQSLVQMRLSLQHRLGEAAHGLSDTEIAKDLLGTTENGIELVCSVKDLDMLAHAGLCQGTTTPDLDGLVGNLVSGAGDVHLEQADRASKVLGLLLVGHVAHLVGDGFQPGLVGLDEGNHLGEPEDTEVSTSM